MHTAIVSTDVPGISYPARGSGAFAAQLARLLSSSGRQVTLVHVGRDGERAQLDPAWALTYQAQHIDVVQLVAPFPPERYPYAPEVRRSEEAAAAVQDAGVVYFADRAGHAFHSVRSGRFQATRRPVSVTVLHGPSAWVRQGMWHYPSVPDDLNQDFVEAYALRHADFVVSPGRYMLDWLGLQGWTLPPPERQRVLGLPFEPPALAAPEPAPAPAAKQLIYFGRVETRKGFDLFMLALERLVQRRPEAARQAGRVVVLGAETEHPWGTASAAAEFAAGLGFALEFISHLDSRGAQQYLTNHAAEALVVLASPFDNFPYTLVEASLIPGLDFVCSRGGGMAEVLGEAAQGRLFDPNPESLAARLAERLCPTAPALPASPYDYTVANRRWLEFHAEVCAGADRPGVIVANPGARSQADAAAAGTVAAPDSGLHPTAHARPGRPATRPAVDVCVPHYNSPKYLPQLLRSLEHQTCQDFTVYVVDDGSTQADALAVFSRMQERYTARGWTFVRQANAFVDAARNAAARLGSAEYICFFDADDVAAPNMVERFLSAIRQSGDDCLVSPSYLFNGDAPPYDLHSGRITAPPVKRYMPLGSSLVAGIVDPAVFGGPALIIRRAVFEAIGGFTEWRGAGQEDFELHARLALAGYRTDVLPEYLHYYRQLPGGLSKRTDQQLDSERMLRAYRTHLAASGLADAPEAFYRLYQQYVAARQRETKLARMQRARVNPLRRAYQQWMPSSARMLFFPLLSRLERRWQRRR